MFDYIKVLWSVVIRQASTWLEAIGTVALAISGQAAASALLPYTNQGDTQTWGMAVFIPMFLTQATLWALLWAFLRANKQSSIPPEVGQATSSPEES